MTETVTEVVTEMVAEMVAEKKKAKTEEIERLTNKKLKSIKPRKKYYRIRIKNSPGLTLRVEPTGNIVFRYRYQLDGQQREMSLGSYPHKKKQELLAVYADHVCKVKSGEDPFAVRIKEERINPTITDFSIEYIENCENRGLRPPTIKEYRRIFNRYILKKHPGIPALARMEVSELRRRDISLLVNYIARKMPNTYRGEKTKGAPTQSNRVLAVLSGFCKFAIENELLEFNPAAAVSKPGKVRTKDRYLTMDEIKTVHDVIKESGTRLIYNAFMMGLLTGQRINQIATVKTSYIKDGWLEFPGEVMKSGKLHKIYLCEQMTQIINQRRADRLATTFVFPGTKKNSHVHPDSLKRALKRLQPLCQAAGVPSFSFHDLRRTLSTHFNRLGFRGIDKAVLGHSVSGVTDIHYNRYDLASEIEKALTLWGEAVERAIDGTQADIISINQQ